METRAHYILVGLFTLAGLAAALAFSLWLAGSGGEREVYYYDVLFREAVSGLNVGSPVQYSGIRVGEVQELNLDPQDPRLVRARIQVSASAPVKVDTVARRSLLNITGASAIELSEGLPESPRLTSSNGVPEIEATPSSLSQLRVTSEEMLVSASTLLERANRLFSDDNASRVSRVLDNVDGVTSVLVAQQQVLQKGLEGIAQSTYTLNNVLTRIDQQLTRYDEPMLEGVSSAITDLQQVTQQLNTMLADNSPALTAGMQGFAELGPAMRELRSILTNIDTMTRRLAEDPASFVLGNEAIREYQP
ncbi:MAG: MlaD family protein [Gammaproteobacteria bacterium]|nr:MCE family protein [Pseudomonadales bacterium]MCP5348882.1 MCE family protein [Pseudomonadales bacterium]